ncbi:hypothetical protein ILUMI_15777 [Ignelater luminosus]|uniref:Uncharacterized protein n=1 Tax=Ignelater luminosus TaxID=2038154 RepID=A0A8K0CSE5_IGNLU|nr:hypothetical protein ILUMI_15777 [Ignelater luminosus]
MFKLVVLYALLAIAVAEPGLYHGARLGYAVPAVAAVPAAPTIAAVSAGYSRTYRTDIIHVPAVASYAVAAPVAYAAAPIAHAAIAAPVERAAFAAPLAYGAPALRLGYGAAPLAYARHLW